MKFKIKTILAAIVFCLGGIFNVFLAAAVHGMLLAREPPKFKGFSDSLAILKSEQRGFIIWLCLQAVLLLLLILFMTADNKPYRADMQQITPDISVPIPYGQGQHGTSRWMTEKEKQSAFTSFNLAPSGEIARLITQGEDYYSGAEKGYFRKPDVVTVKAPPLKTGGVVVGMRKSGETENIAYLDDDIHTITIGSTGSGKTRCLVIQSICTLALAGEGIVTNDPKGELYHYTHKFLESLGYEVIVLDFQTPAKSSRYNMLQTVIDAINRNDIEAAQSYTWDMVNLLVPKNDKGEPIWTNGEMSVISAAILSVVYDNQDKPEYQNMTNVYFFIANMCKATEGKAKIDDYAKSLTDNHPAKAMLGISEVAPGKTAASFYASALTTLRLFTSKGIYAITSASDFNLADIARKKQAVFFILPDEKTTFYPVVTLLVSQQYEQLVKLAKQSGNRLPTRVNFLLDEFGNFTQIADIEAKLTVARGYGIRFNLFLQDFNQLDHKYGKEVSAIIKGNCQVWIYLLTTDQDTLEIISKRLGNYTTQSYSLSGNLQRYSNPTSGHNVSLISRELLQPAEISHIKRPYQLVISPSFPAVMQSPDLSQWYFNRMLGLGDKAHNTRYIELDERERPATVNTELEIPIWHWRPSSDKRMFWS